MKKKLNRYERLITEIFERGHHPGIQEIPFDREALEITAQKLSIKLPKNLGDVLYSFRYRNPLPEKILKTQEPGKEWIINGAGRAKYQFRLVPISRIAPNSNLLSVKIPDATPEIVTSAALSDEQALLAKVRYNRLIDLFMGFSAYSLQNHLRTTVKGLGQIEIDELYIAVDRFGCQYVIPVQAKGGSDQLSTVQAKQDLACCAEKFPDLICRPVSTQFMTEDRIAIFELGLDETDEVGIIDERHYSLVPGDSITVKDLENYRRSRK